MEKIDLGFLIDKWPSALVSRDQVENFSGGAISAKYLANLDCQGEGPPGRFRIGRKVVYPAAALASWLEGRATRI